MRGAHIYSTCTSDVESCRKLRKLRNFGKVAENAKSCGKLREIEKVAESCGKWQKLWYRNYIVPLVNIGLYGFE